MFHLKGAREFSIVKLTLFQFHRVVFKVDTLTVVQYVVVVSQHLMVKIYR